MAFVPVRHDQYYLESVIFLVEDALFRVPRYPFERNAVFATVFSLPVGQHGVAEGVNDENPFKLEGISKVDFVNFLRVVYPMNMISYEIDMGVDAWISVLKLSTMWDFVETRRLAIQQLSKLGIDLVSKVLLGKQYRVQEWLFNAYEGLAKRMEPISVDEARRLGLETAIRIYQIREEGASEIPRRRAHRNTPDNRGFGNLDSQTQHYLGAGRFLPMPTHEEVGPIVREQDDYSQKIRREFVEELKEVEEQEIAETIR